MFSTHKHLPETVYPKQTTICEITVAVIVVFVVVIVIVFVIITIATTTYHYQVRR